MSDHYLRWAKTVSKEYTAAIGIGERGNNYHIVKNYTPGGEIAYDIILQKDNGTYEGYIGDPTQEFPRDVRHKTLAEAQEKAQEDYEKLCSQVRVYWFYGESTINKFPKGERVPYIYAVAWADNGEYRIYKDKDPAPGFGGSAEKCYQVDHILEDGRVTGLSGEMYHTLEEAIGLCQKQQDKFREASYKKPGDGNERG